MDPTNDRNPGRPPALADAAPSGPPQSERKEQRRAGSPKHILLVEDEPGLRHLLRITLTGPAFRISETGSGAQALALALSSPPDLIILDLYLTPAHPDGLEVCRQVKNTPALAQTRVLMLTGTTRADDRAAALRAGADGYFTKPFSPLALLDQIYALLNEPEEA